MPLHFVFLTLHLWHALRVRVLLHGTTLSVLDDNRGIAFFSCKVKDIDQFVLFRNKHQGFQIQRQQALNPNPKKAN